MPVFPPCRRNQRIQTACRRAQGFCRLVSLGIHGVGRQPTRLGSSRLHRPQGGNLGLHTAAHGAVNLNQIGRSHLFAMRLD
ncbi:hypothetical protein BHU43_07975 [Neisseria meningitidis]|nr:hypothetical protein BFX78_09085 [Neisseria meningitidis]ODP41262.1 hypothetical protein BFX79_08650 [Neisseria meningitidis]OEH87932.1 hypothetical protein BHU43_07975 [Neisseria meningitidis]